MVHKIFMTSCCLFILGVSGLMLSGMTYSQGLTLSDEDLAMNLIVKISGDLGEGNTNNVVGAGIIIGIDDSFIYIITADHVVRRGPSVAQNAKVQFKFWPGSPIPAKLLDNRSEKFDLATLRVNLAESEMTPEKFRENVRFDQTGYVPNIDRQLHLRDDMFPIGHPGVDWQLALNPGKFRTMVDQVTFRFEYDCEDGHSGGGVFTENWGLLGMLQRQFGKDCEAITFEGMRATLREWGVPIALKEIPPPTPTPVPTLQETVSPPPSPVDPSQEGVSAKSVTPTPVPSPTIVMTETPAPGPTPFPMPAMAPVAKGNYEISPYLQQYVRYAFKTGLLSNPVTIAQDFSIQVGEVTVGEFRRYAESLDDTARADLGTRWAQGADGAPYDDDRPVENVTWQEASDYARWLSAKTQRDLRLPTLEQWIAACVKYAEEYPILKKTYDEPVSKLRSQVDHLLGNVREWSSSPCAGGGYRLLGENYRTKPEYIGEDNCLYQSQKTPEKGFNPEESFRWPGVGFRLVNIE